MNKSRNKSTSDFSILGLRWRLFRASPTSGRFDHESKLTDARSLCCQTHTYKRMPSSYPCITSTRTKTYQHGQRTLHHIILRLSEWVSIVLRPHQHSIGYTENGFYRSKDPTNSIKVLKEDLQKKKKTCISLWHWQHFIQSWSTTRHPSQLNDSTRLDQLNHFAPLPVILSVCISVREHTDLESSTESIPIRVDRIFFDPLMNRYSDPSTISHLLSSHVD